MKNLIEKEEKCEAFDWDGQDEKAGLEIATLALFCHFYSPGVKTMGIDYGMKQVRTHTFDFNNYLYRCF